MRFFKTENESTFKIKKTQFEFVQISYFATIKQNTGEDWKDAKLYLTTGMPSIGQSPPKLTVQNVDVGTQKHSYRKAAR